MRALKPKYRGFTMIELVVVIAVIAILSTLVVVSLDSAKMTGRDVRRLTDIKQIQLALKMYYNDTGRYPTAITPGGSIANGGTNYLLRVPANPVPRSDKNCPDSDYVYTSLEGGQRYTLSFCLGDKTDDLSGGQKTATANGILECDDGYVMVPGSSIFDTNDFCVMKYEAKCVEESNPTEGMDAPLNADGGFDNTSATCDDDRHLASVPSGRPVTNISQADARSYCADIGAHLMTNAEWMTIARNAEQVAANWSGDEVGNGALYGREMPGSITNDIYNQSSLSVQQENGFKLSTGQFIWRLGNNVAEWTDDTCIGGTGEGKYSQSSILKWDDGDLDDYERAASGPSNNSWNDSHGAGMYNGCFSDGNAFIRGNGQFAGDNNNGLYNLDLSTDPGSLNNLVGFRCVK